MLSGPDYDGGLPDAEQLTDGAGESHFDLKGYTAGTDVVSAFVALGNGAISSNFANVTFVTHPGDLSASSAGTIGAVEGQLIGAPKAQPLATFKDPDSKSLPSSSFSARVDWGDPLFYSTAATVKANNGTYTVVTPFAHVFCRPGSYAYSITILEPSDLESVVVHGVFKVSFKEATDEYCAIGEVFRGTTDNPLTPEGACSGTSVASKTGMMLIWAAHCLDYNSDNSVAPRWYFFVPDQPYNLSSKYFFRPFGTWRSTSAFADTLFNGAGGANVNRAYDYSYIYVNQGCVVAGFYGQCPRPGVTLDQVLGGGLPIAWDAPQGQTLTIDQPGTDPPTCSTVPSMTSFGTGPDNYVMPSCGMQEGVGIPLSGAPWIDANDSVVSVIAGAGSFVFLPNPIAQPALFGTCLSSTCPNSRQPSQAKLDFDSFEQQSR